MWAWLLRPRTAKLCCYWSMKQLQRDLTAVSATGWEVLPGSQMLLLGKMCPAQPSIWDPRLPLKWWKALGCGGQKAFRAVPQPSFQLAENVLWKVGVLKRASLKTWVKNNLRTLFLYLPKHVPLIKTFYPCFLWDHCLKAGKYILKLNHSLIFILWCICVWGAGGGVTNLCPNLFSVKSRQNPH